MVAANGAELLDRVAAFLRRYLRMSEAQVVVVTLWTVHTHAFDAADATPYLCVHSAEKQSGKTRLLEVLMPLVAKPWFTGRVSPAVLTRKIEDQCPTLLLDESDAAFRSGEEYAQALRGALNSGHRRGGMASCCVGQGANLTYKDFHVFNPKAIAGIGRLPDTVSDRSIPILMKRQATTEKAERFRWKRAKGEADEIRSRLAQWAAARIQQLRDAEPELPESLTDRQQDGVEPLLAIADLAGGDWPQRARAAMSEIFTGAAAEDDSIRVRLLADIRAIFDAKGAEKLPSFEIVATLTEDETSPWGEFSHGRPLTAVQLARLLRPFEIAPRTVKLPNGSTLKGYQRESFEDAWSRYLPPPDGSIAPAPPPETSPPSPARVCAGLPPFPEPPPDDVVTGRERPERPVNTGLVTRVTTRKPTSASPRDGREGPPSSDCPIHGFQTEWRQRPPENGGGWLCKQCHP